MPHTDEKNREVVNVLITVNLVEGVELDTNDVDENGDDTIAGIYCVHVSPEAAANRLVEDGDDPMIETALDYFHEHIAISTLDNYEITAGVAFADHPPGVVYL